MNVIDEVLIRKNGLILLVKNRLKEVREEVKEDFFSAYIKEQLSEDLMENICILMSDKVSEDKKYLTMINLFNNYLCKKGKEEDCI